MDRNKTFPFPIPRIGGFFIGIVLLLTPILNTFAGVLVAPTVVILSENDRTGRITVQNPSDKPKEVSVYFSFGLPVSDSLGAVTIQLQDSGVTDPRSALNWIKAFPEKIVLEPGATQVIRLRANPPKNLPDGEYWTRIVVKSQEGETNIPVASDPTKISTRLNMIMQTAIMLKYRTGDLLSKLEVINTDARIIDSAVQVTVDMTNRGNVSYVGILKCKLLDATGKEIANYHIDLAVYHNLTRRFKLPLPGQGFIKPYRTEISISTAGRTDIPEDAIVQGNIINFSKNIE
ncbi:MAG: hypothetical protein NTV06_06480 [candidate division Zixibacteria bacterium]|nr:hypothetical protein [candidate division Zixibacteria bacterium]